MKELVSVIIPVLNPDLNPVEERLLHHALEVLEDYPLIFITYEKADLSIIREHKEEIDVIYFSKEYFESRNALAKLFLMPDFYDQFSWASFILIHELNSWIVKDELHYWCKQGYDYLKSAPKPTSVASSFISGITGLNLIQKQAIGNGFQNNGFNLCLVERMVSVLKSKQKTAYQYRHQEKITNFDSVFWEIESNRFLPNLRKPTRIVQNYFAQHLDDLNLSVAITKEKLPFAITGIDSSNIEKLPNFG